MAEINLTNNFTAGYLGPKFIGNFDADQYPKGLFDCKNMLVIPGGGVTRRPGSNYVQTMVSSSERMIPFYVDRTTAYVILFRTGDLKIYRNNDTLAATVSNYTNLAGSTVAISNSTDFLDNFDYDQSRDVMYVTYRSRRWLKLTRVSDTSWTLAEVDEKDGPFDDLNANPERRLDANSTTGASEVAAVNKAGSAISNFWNSNDIGRLIRIRNNHDVDNIECTNWGSTRIDSIKSGTSNSVVNTTIQTDYPLGSQTGTNPGVSRFYRLGLLNDFYGYPEVLCFDKNRLLSARDDRVFGSVANSYEQYSPTVPATDTVVTGGASNQGTSHVVNDSCGLNLRLLSMKSAKITFLKSDQVLHVGTDSGRYTLRGASAFGPVTPSDAAFVKQSDTPCAKIKPVVLDTMFFVHANKRILYRTEYDFRRDRYLEQDLTTLADDVLYSRVKAICKVTYPFKMVWCALEDGTMAVLSYDEVLQVAAWSKHELSHGDVLDVISVPDINGDDQIYLKVLHGTTYKVEKICKWAYKKPNGTPIDYSLLDGGYMSPSGPPTTSISAGWLPNETVDLVDIYGNNRKSITLDGSGNATLSTSTPGGWQIGFPMEVYVTTLPFDFFISKQTVITKRKELKEIKCALFATEDLWAQQIGSTMEEPIVFRDGNVVQGQPTVESGIYDVKPATNTQDDLYIKLYQKNSAPVTILSISQEVKVEQ